MSSGIIDKQYKSDVVSAFLVKDNLVSGCQNLNVQKLRKVKQLIPNNIRFSPYHNDVNYGTSLHGLQVIMDAYKKLIMMYENELNIKYDFHYPCAFIDKSNMLTFKYLYLENTKNS